MAKTTTFHRLYCLLVLLLLATSCRRDAGREVIVYRGDDGQNWIMNPDGTDAHTFLPDIGATALKWSSDGRQVAFNMHTDQGIAIWVASSDGSEPHPVTAAYEDMGVQAWLNEHMLLVRIRADVTDRYSDVHYTLNLQDGSMQAYSQSFERAVPFPSGDRWVAHNLYDLPGLTLYSLDQAPQKLFADFWVDPMNFDVSPSGQEVVVCGTHHAKDGPEATGVFRQEVDGAGEPTRVHTLNSCGPVRWSPSEQYIALLKIDETLCIFDASTNEIKYEYTVGPLVTSSFVWSPRSDAILIARHHGEPGPSPKELASVDVKTGAITRLTDNDINESSPSWVVVQ
jgi:hypothetical protein